MAASRKLHEEWRNVPGTDLMVSDAVVWHILKRRTWRHVP